LDPPPEKPLPERTRGLIDRVLGKLVKLIEEMECPSATESAEAGKESNQRYLDALRAFERRHADVTDVIDDLVEAGYGGRYGGDEWGLEAMGRQALRPYEEGDEPNATKIGYLYESLTSDWSGSRQKPRAGFAAMPLFWLRKLQEALLKARKVCPDEQSRPADDSEDGPVAPDGFRYCGKVYSPLARGPFRALSVAWESEGRCVDREDLAETLYEDREEPVNENTLRDLRGALNDFFRAYNIPYKAIGKRSQI
jgi:hypothetical protein